MEHFKGTIFFIASAANYTVAFIDIDKGLNRGCLVLGAILSVFGIISYYYNIREKRASTRARKNIPNIPN